MKSEMKLIIALSLTFSIMACGMLIVEDANAETVPLDITGQDGITYHISYSAHASASYTGSTSYQTEEYTYLGVVANLVTDDGEILLPVTNLNPGAAVKLPEEAPADGVYKNVVPFQFNITIMESTGIEVTYLIKGYGDLIVKKESIAQYLSATLIYNNKAQAPTIDDIEAKETLWKLKIFEEQIDIDKLITIETVETQVHANSCMDASDSCYYMKVKLTKEYSKYFSEGDQPFDIVWKINPASLEKDVYNVYFESLTYNGKIQSPTVLYVTFNSTNEEVAIDNVSIKSFRLTAVTASKNAGEYYATAEGYNDFTDAWTGIYVIEKKMVDLTWITIDPNELEYTGEPLTPASVNAIVTVIDPDLNYKIPSKYVSVKYTERTEPGFGNTEVTISKKCPNYSADPNPIVIVGDADKDGTLDNNEWAIVEPTVLMGEVHVNLIRTNGTLTADMFTDDNTFIYPYSSDYRTYDDDGKYVGPDPVKISRNNYKIVVLDANGNIVINEIDPVNKPGSEKTASEWNHIELYGTNGFRGCITGTFYVAFDNNFNSIGDSVNVDGITYTVTSLDNKTVSVTGYEEGIASALVIPDFVNGFKVTKIADKAFYGCKTITSLELGDYVTSIGVKAFTNCTKLQSVEFEDSLKTISAYAFYGCTRLADVSMDDSVKTIGSYAFYKCTALKTINISGALKTLGGNAFSVSFIDADGKGITQTAKNLAGHTFEGSNKVLKLVA